MVADYPITTEITTLIVIRTIYSSGAAVMEMLINFSKVSFKAITYSS